MNTRKWLTMSSIVVLLMLALAVGLTQAQGPEPPRGKVQPQSEAAATAVEDRIPIQGRLTDNSGNPLSGTYDIRFCLYDAATGGTNLCQDTDPVEVHNGLFNAYVDHCTSGDINGRSLYLGIKVADDDEMTDRQPIYPVPYAWSLRPGAVISDTRDGILTVRSTGSGDADAFRAYGGGSGEGVEAHSTDGAALFAESENYLALQAYSTAAYTRTNPGIFGCSADSWSTCDPYRDDNSAGVMGFSDHAFGGYFVSSQDGGVYAEAQNVLGIGVWAENTANGIAFYGDTNSSGDLLSTLYLVQRNSEGNFVIGASGLGSTRYWRVDRTGKGFFNGGTQSSGADFAEQMAVEGEEAEYEPGDVLVISGSADQVVELSAESFATAVIGVYSTEPAVLAGAPDTDDPLEGIPVAITGIVPCKVSAENGAIHRGDLLVTASTPGHAMRAGDDPPQGTVLGKALGELTEGTGVVHIVVTLQ
jgi:hypothetical protein